MKSVVRIGANRKGKDLDAAVTGDRPQIDARAELIQALIPIGLEAVNELLQQEVVSLVGVRYSHGGGEGKSSGGRHPVTPWGVPTKGYKTRRRKPSDKFIVKRRK